MVYLLATFANDVDYMPSLIYALSQQLAASETSSNPETWGVGYYNDDRALIIKKPGHLLEQRSVYALAPEVKSRIVLACAKTGADREGLPPHRFRRWMFGYAGDLSGLEAMRGTITEKLPDFVRTKVGEASVGALAFGMFLADLHRSVGLEDALADCATLARVLHGTAETIERLSSEAAERAVKASYVATNGRVVLVSQRGAPVAWTIREGLERLPDGPPDPARTDFSQVAEALKRFRAVVVTHGEAGAGWTSLEPGRTLGIDSQLHTHQL